MKKLLIPLVVILSFFSCDKKSETMGICTDGYIHWGGEPAVDGLGWYFKGTAEIKYAVKLKDLPAAFQTDSLAVTVCLQKTDEKYYCFCSQPMEVYIIKSIQKK